MRLDRLQGDPYYHYEPVGGRNPQSSHDLVALRVGNRPHLPGERLDDRHVMAGAICVRPVPMRHQPGKAGLRDRAVGGIETCLGADRAYAAIGDAALHSGEQPGDLTDVSAMLLELPDPEQVRQAHLRRP